MKGKVYLIGAGPGRPDLITVRGLEILRQADVVIYDYLVDRGLLAEAKENAELICCDKLGEDRYSDGFLIHNEKINQLVIKKVKEGKKVIRLKNGDPAIFSRLSQELDTLVRKKIEFEIVPGVPAANAASCLSGIPLTDRRFTSDCVFVTGHQDPTKKESSLDPSTSLEGHGERSRTIDWDSLSKIGTIILYMAVENLSQIIKQLIKVGKSLDTPVAIIQDASLITQKVLTGTLKNIITKAKKAKVRPPAIIIIGEVVKLEQKFNWLKKGKRILFTGLSKERFFTRDIYFHLPLIKIEPLRDYTELDNHLKSIKEFDWILFLSRYGVQFFFQRLNKIGYDSRILNNVKIAAIGDSTRRRLLDFGILADMVPKEESSKGLINEFKKIDIRHKRIFLPRSDISDKGLQAALQRQGAMVDSGVAYQNVMPNDLPDLDLNFFNGIIFTSPSGVRNFVKRYKALPGKVKVNCIGEVTLREAKRWHLLG